MCVAEPAAAALCNQDTIAGMREVGDQPWRNVRRAGVVVDQRADRDLDFQVLAVSAGAVGAFSVPAARRFELGMEPEIDEGVDVRARDDVDRTAMAAVAAARDRLEGRTSRGGTPDNRARLFPP